MRNTSSTCHRVRLPPPRRAPGTEEGHRGLLEGPRRAPTPCSTRPPSCGCSDWQELRRRRHRRDPHRRLLVLRPRPGHRRHGRRDPGPAPRRRADVTARRGRLDGYFAMARGTAGRRAAGDDQVVRHQLPLPGPGAGPGHRLRRRPDQAGRRVRRRPGARRHHPARVSSARSPTCCWPSPRPARAADFDPLTLLDRLLPVYAEVLADLRAAGAEWVQLDEPALVQDQPPPS